MKELDFLPQSFHEGVRRRRVRRRSLAYMAAVVVGLGSLHLVSSARLNSAQASLQQIRHRNNDRQYLRDVRSALEGRKSALEKSAALVDTLDDGAPMDAVVAEITRIMGDTMALRSIRLDAEPQEDAADEPAAAPPAPAQLVLTAVAGSDVEVGIFYGRLVSCPLFSDVTMTFSRQGESQGHAVREFEMKCVVRRVAVATRPAGST